MAKTLIILGLIFTSLGALLLFLKNFIFTGESQKNYTNPWHKRYSWHAWRPFYRNTQTHKLVLKLNHVVSVEGFLPPKDILEILAILFITSGIIMQIISILY
jgi:hypothetical protein